MTPREILDAASITAVWSGLGGPPLRRGRGQAWWRNGDGFNVTLNERDGLWKDHSHGGGGGILHLIETALGCDRRASLAWLTGHLGVSLGNHRLSRAERQVSARRLAQAKAKARELSEWRTGQRNSLRDRRNRLWDSERQVCDWARRHLADPSMDDDPRWEAVWASALDDQRGDEVGRELSRIEALSPAELIAEQQQLEVEAA